MRKATLEEAMRAFQDLHEDYVPRFGKSSSDFGSPDTRLLDIRRLESNDLDPPEFFGKYLGYLHGEFFIAMSDGNGGFSGYLAYPNRQELIKEWELY